MVWSGGETRTQCWWCFAEIACGNGWLGWRPACLGYADASRSRAQQTYLLLLRSKEEREGKPWHWCRGRCTMAHLHRRMGLGQT